MTCRALRQAKEHLREVLSPEEFRTLEITETRRHFKGVVKATGLRFAIPRSPGDHRWFKNWTHQLRRARNSLSGEC